MDYDLKQSIDLDKAYTKLIKPTLDEFKEIDSIRGDEMSGSESIDKKMFELLISADIVIADISTLNTNAIYELGIRHALRPYSTIILGLNGDKIPFDFNHNRILKYSVQEIETEDLLKNKKLELKKWINNILTNKKCTDSPFYNSVYYLKPPKLSNDEINKIKKEIFKDSDNSIKSLKNKIKDLKHNKDYLKVSKVFQTLAKKNLNNDYYIQQQALFLSKVKKNNKQMLIEAEKVIRTINPETSLDSETTGIYGSIEKKLYAATNAKIKLENAINSYNRGFILCNDYYNGENVINCLIYKIINKEYKNDEELIYLKIRIQKLNKEVIKLAKETLNNSYKPESEYWIYATLSLSYLLDNDEENYKEYKNLFYNYSIYSWETSAYRLTEDQRINANLKL